MYKTVFSFLLLSIISISHGQTSKTTALADSLLHAGTFKIAITRYSFPAEIRVLQEKALANLKKDPEWKDKYIVKLMEDGAKNDLHFMKAYGLTNEEFDTMLAGFKRGKSVVLSDTGTIIIKKQGAVISFTSSGKFELLNYLKINTTKQIISFDGLVVKREVKFDGEYFAPGLNGYQAINSSGVVSARLKDKLSYFALFIGVNNGDTRPCLCLGYGIGDGLSTSPKFLVTTIF